MIEFITVEFIIEKQAVQQIHRHCAVLKAVCNPPGRLERSFRAVYALKTCLIAKLLS